MCNAVCPPKLCYHILILSLLQKSLTVVRKYVESFGALCTSCKPRGWPQSKRMIYLRCRLREPFAVFVFEFLLFAFDVSPGKKSRPLYFVSFIALATFAGKIALFLRQSRYNVAIKIYLGRQNITMSIVSRSRGRRVEWTLYVGIFIESLPVRYSCTYSKSQASSKVLPNRSYFNSIS